VIITEGRRSGRSYALSDLRAGDIWRYRGDTEVWLTTPGNEYILLGRSGTQAVRTVSDRDIEILEVELYIKGPLP
jgi:hypothetical protein